MSKRILSLAAALMLAAATFALTAGAVRAEEPAPEAAAPVVVEDAPADDGTDEEGEQPAAGEEPADGDAAPAEGDAAEPEVAGPELAEPEIVEPEIVEPDAAELEADGPELAESEAPAEDDAAEMTEEEYLAYLAENDLANSFRFQDGVRIVQPDGSSGGLRLMANSGVVPWSYNGSGWVNNKGQVISGATAKGIDVSEWNDRIDWAKVKNDGISFAILRVGHGTRTGAGFALDATFVYNAQECERLGIPYGVYVYSYASNASQAAKEAEGVINALKGRTVSYPVYIDIEDKNAQGSLSASEFASLASAFCTRIEQAGYEPGVYSMLDWWERYFTSSVFNKWSKWIAQYYSTCEYEGSYRLWQCTGTGAVAGINGDVDIDFEFGGASAAPSVPATIPAKNASGSYAHPVAAGEYNIISALSSSKVVDTYNNSTASGANIQLWAYTNGGGDRFKLAVDSQGLYTIQNSRSGMYLSLEGAGSGYGRNVVQRSGATTLAQKWIIEKSGSGYIIRSAYNTGYVLDVEGESTGNGTNIGVWPATGGTNQRWSFRSLAYKAEQTVADGTYYITCSGNSSIVLDVEALSTKAGANIAFWTSNKGKNQQFKVTYAGNGYYTIVGVGSGMALDVEGESKRSGTNIIQWTAGKNKDNQLWAIIRNSDGTYSFASKHAGLLLTASGGAKQGANACLGPMSYSASQRFGLTKVSSSSTAASANPNRPIANGTYVIQSAMSSNLVLDVEAISMKNGANVETWTFNNGKNQQWVVTWDSSANAYSIKSVASGKYLDAEGESTKAGTNIIQWTSTNGKNQRWKIVANGSGYRIVSAMNANMVIDIEGASTKAGANVCLWTANGGANQRFTFKPAGGSSAAATTGRVLSDGTYEIALASTPTLVLDVAGESRSDRANICLWTDHNGANQRFRFTWDSSAGAYTITNVNSGYVMDLAGAKAVSGANIQQYHSVGYTPDQRWIITKTATGYKIASAVDPTYYLCLDSTSPKAGTNVELGTSSSATLFEIRAV